MVDFSIFRSLGIKLTMCCIVPMLVGAPALAEVPDYMKVVVTEEGKVTPKDKIAFRNIYALNNEMFSVYERSASIYKRHIRERVPLIMGLFSGKGGRFILYKPGEKEPIEAPPPPQVYQLAKSVGHTAMGTYELVAPYCENSAKDLSWFSELKIFRKRVATALESLDDLKVTDDEREALRKPLTKIAAFMDNCIKNKSFTYQEVEDYARGIKPDLVKLIAIASGHQVAHWFKVLDGWKKMLGDDWDKTYGLTNTIYVARQNNILYSVMVQYFGENAMNDRLLMLETTDFFTTPEDMLTAFARILSDRTIGQIFFKNYKLMDYELLGFGGRAAIKRECEKRGWKAKLPDLVQFNSHDWPWKTDRSKGSGPSSFADIK